MTDTIHVTKSDRNNRKLFSSSNPFFKTAERFIIKEGKDYVSFTIATSVTEERTLKASRNLNSNFSHFSFKTKVPIGEYTPDKDDSDEDTLTFYF